MVFPPSEFGQEKSIGPQPLGPKGTNPLRLFPHGARQPESLQRKAPMGSQKGPDHRLILLRTKGTGGVKQHPARLDIMGHIVQNLPLQRGQSGQLFLGLIANLRLFANDL